MGRGNRKPGEPTPISPRVPGGDEAIPGYDPPEHPQVRAGMSARDAAELALLAGALNWFTEVFVDRDTFLLHEGIAPQPGSRAVWYMVVAWEESGEKISKQFFHPDEFWDAVEQVSPRHRG